MLLLAEGSHDHIHGNTDGALDVVGVAEGRVDFDQIHGTKNTCDENKGTCE